MIVVIDILPFVESGMSIANIKIIYYQVFVIPESSYVIIWMDKCHKFNINTKGECFISREYVSRHSLVGLMWDPLSTLTHPCIQSSAKSNGHNAFGTAS
jgi:hypothetical protein